MITEFNVQMALETESKQLDRQTVSRGIEEGLQQPHKCRFFVVEHQGTVVGQAMITYEWSEWENGDLWWIQSVYVHPDYRRQGIFKMLFRHIESLARNEPKIKGLRLYVMDNNKTGQSVYKKLGMAYTGYHVYEITL